MKKFLFLITLLSAMLFATSAFAIDGEGTEESPFLITTQEELLLINDFPDCHFKLMNDIECSTPWNYSITFTGIFDGNHFSISNFKGGPFVYSNKGTIKNTKFSATSASKAIISSNNYGKIINCITYGTVSGSGSLSGFSAFNHEQGLIKNCMSYAKVNSNTSGGKNNHISSTTTSGASAFVEYNLGNIENSFAICDVISHAYSYYWTSYSYASGFVYNNSGNISNCYAVTTTKATEAHGYSGISAGHQIAFIYDNTGTVNNCFYDNTNTSSNLVTGVTPKTTLAMKMKKTYTDAGWDFDKVWGISPEINDGYPYLLWEFPSANTEIIGATATDDSLKFISEVTIEGEPEISSFGTTFIPLWLFESGSTDVATVSYDNSNYNISNAQTFGATLTGIPESCKDMEIIGKSFIKDVNGIYTWSSAKSASINDTTLNSLE